METNENQDFINFSKSFIAERINKIINDEAALPIGGNNQPLLVIHLIPEYLALYNKEVEDDIIKSLYMNEDYLNPIRSPYDSQTRNDIDGFIKYILTENNEYAESYTKLFYNGIIEIVDNVTGDIEKKENNTYASTELFKMLRIHLEKFFLRLFTLDNKVNTCAISISLLNMKGFKTQNTSSWKSPNHFGVTNNNISTGVLLFNNKSNLQELINKITLRVKKAFG